MAATAAQQGSRLLIPRLAFAASGAVALGTSGLIFRDLADFSHWVHKPNRNAVVETFHRRHELSQAYIASTLINTALYLSKPAILPSKWIWVGFNGCTLALWFSGYINPELMMRPRNKNALFVSTCAASKILKPTDLCIVTQLTNDAEPVCFPDAQLMRPHIASVPGTLKDGTTPATIAYCALTGTGIVYATPNLPDGRPREFVPYIQLENNLVVLDKTTGHFGHQINGLDENKLLEKMGETDFQKVGRRPKVAELEKLGVQPATEVQTWRMTVGNFGQAFPHGRVFINDYKEYPDFLKAPVLTIYDKMIQLVFDIFIGYHQTSEKPIFPTVENIDPRLHAKMRVWGFNVGDDYVALTEDFVKEKNRNLVVGGQPLVASWDPATESLGIFERPNHKPITVPVDVYGNVGKKQQHLERLTTVKNGLFWFSWQNFFPQTTVNPTK